MRETKGAGLVRGGKTGGEASMRGGGDSLTVDLLLVDGFDVIVVVAIAVGGCGWRG